jgi:hypothetical protein
MLDIQKCQQGPSSQMQTTRTGSHKSSRGPQGQTHGLQFFEPYGFRSRSSCSTGSLMRSLSSLVGALADPRLPLFSLWKHGALQVVCNLFSVLKISQGLGGAARGGLLLLQRQALAPMTGTMLALNVNCMTDAVLSPACKDYAPARVYCIWYDWFYKID